MKGCTQQLLAEALSQGVHPTGGWQLISRPKLSSDTILVYNVSSNICCLNKIMAAQLLQLQLVQACGLAATPTHANARSITSSCLQASCW
jgi:hypothetical protein